MPTETETGNETAQERQEAETGESPRPRATGWLVAVTIVALVLAGAIVAGILELRTVNRYRDHNAQRDAILGVAKELAQVSYSLDYEKYPQQSTHIADLSTGKFRQGVVDSAQGLGSLLTQGKVKSTCEITGAGIEQDDGNTATVLLSITTHLTNTQIQTPQNRDYRVAIGLVRQGEQWLVQSNDVIA